MSPAAELAWLDDYRFVLGGVEFVTTGTETGDAAHEAAALFTAGSVGSRPDRFTILKSRQLIEHYVDVIRRTRPERIVELGIFEGGGVALLAELARPVALVAIDADPRPIEALTEYCRDRPAAAGVRTHYGLDQADRLRLRQVVDDALGDEPLDLVIDDASHRLDETRASFDELFPRLRPGGTYIIEDWSWGAAPSEHFELGGTPLAVMVFELLLACSWTRGLIDDVEVRWNVVTVTRGRAPIDDPEAFSLRSCYHERWTAYIDEGPSLLDRPVGDGGGVRP